VRCLYFEANRCSIVLTAFILVDTTPLRMLLDVYEENARLKDEVV